MAWEKRQRGGRYYTRSHREHGRVVREYVPVAVAETLAQIDAWLAEERALEHEAERERRREEQAERERWAARLFGPLEVLDIACDVLMRRELEAAGYHQHKGQWRKKRTGGQHADQEAAAAAGDGHEGAGAGV